MAEQMSVDPQDPYAFDYFLGRDLGAIKGNHTLHRPESQVRQFQYNDYSHVFAYNAQDLLDPSSRLSQRYPQVSQVLRERLGVAFGKRNNEEFSRCNCGDDSGHRCDSEVFQRRNSTSYQDFICLSAEAYGATFIARERGAAGASLEDLEQYAIKSQVHTTQWMDSVSGVHSQMVPFCETSGETRYMPEEALLLIYLDDSKRFPRLNSVYTHAFDGSYLMSTTTKEPQLGETEGCKVASQLIQAMIELADMSVCHADMSVTNYLMDQNLNVQLIDLGMIHFSLHKSGFMSEIDHFIPYHEYQMMPERAIELEKYDTWRDPCHDDVTLEEIYLPIDQRDICLWKYSTIVYGFLHGFWPWDEPEPVPKSLNWHGRYYGPYNDPFYPVVKRRRKRMINEDVPISESLSQDCRDVLQATLSREKSERPSLEELSSFPWFSRWSAEELESGRPLKRPFVKKFHNKSRADGRRGFPWPSISLDHDMSIPVLNTPGYNADYSEYSTGSSYYSTYSDQPGDSEYERLPPQEASP
ncbi:Fatty acyl-CoA synthetase and RNA processing-associated kinase [Penicillium chrysogenum]|uniref:EKC/KEOPS complex subunit BUD32 n=1 Tax=Penicillium chrysogenum TaxID=5076 RepID=A0A167TDM4_PENCH|nr:Fatty acyl-CoA synthetase and RNA processing-associated kinase [Penicillium chrysogenum]